MESSFGGGGGGGGNIDNGASRVGNGAVRSATLGPTSHSGSIRSAGSGVSGLSGGGGGGVANRRNSVYMQNGNHYPTIDRCGGGGGVGEGGGDGGEPPLTAGRRGKLKKSKKSNKRKIFTLIAFFPKS